VTPERWQQVKRVFDETSALAGGAQAAVIERLCEGDGELRAEVESLLAAHAAAAILDKPAVSYMSSADLDLEKRWIGKRIGAWEIVSLLGHGGMGEVYRARRVDAEYDREVAIKLVAGGYPAQFVLQRLRAERQILANLDHPNIARLIDGGATEEGYPYLIMELVDGVPLDRYCELHGLPVRERLRLFRDVCAAVSYAHQRLVVHRDLKPGNILITADGKVKLLDFGIAKLLQEAPGDSTNAPTATVMRALTPGYSSPEQILGKTITTASDVYSLGVVLYGLLTGTSPYRSTLTSTADVIRAVCEAEPARPSESARTPGEKLSRDLDAITLRALRKEPERRYRSVDEFSEDVRRHLDALPVIARGDQFGYRAGKFLRRRKLEIAATLLVGIALIGGLAMSLRQARIAEEQRVRAERHFESVRRLADSFMFEMHDAIKDLPGSTAARKLVLDKALEYLNTLAKDGEPDEDLRLELATAYQKVGDIQGKTGEANTGEAAAAIESYEKAIALLTPMVTAAPADDQARTLLAQAYLQSSRVRLFVGGSKKAAAESARAVEIMEELAARDPSVERLRALSDALRAHTVNVAMSGDTAGGVAAALRAIDIVEQLTRKTPENPAGKFDLAKVYGMGAQAIYANDQSASALAQAVALNLKALELDEEMLKGSGGGNVVYARATMADHSNLASLLYEKPAYDEAVKHARASLPLLDVLEQDNGNANNLIDSALVHWILGHMLVAAGEYAEAQQVFTANLDQLTSMQRTADNLQVQYLIAACEQGLARARVKLAPDSRHDRAGRIAVLTQAKTLYTQAIPRFEKLRAAITLDRTDLRPVEEAAAGLKQVDDELARLR
jgi:tetratricopeptide (TPR) repeat protein